MWGLSVRRKPPHGIVPCQPYGLEPRFRELPPNSHPPRTGKSHAFQWVKPTYVCRFRSGYDVSLTAKRKYVSAWSEWRGSNPRHPVPKAGALSTELHPDIPKTPLETFTHIVLPSDTREVSAPAYQRRSSFWAGLLKPSDNNTEAPSKNLHPVLKIPGGAATPPRPHGGLGSAAPATARRTGTRTRTGPTANRETFYLRIRPAP